ncbi:CIR protein [Plasmodium chabaudi chabaudi]|uniref:CIR protein n=1 Tax=Plasmodium chabaudi chabaudi TaxID=31271 RepID=A0A4V0KB71_PLACU|nr:CIR protein [Plasmodium chabaudi chabaudi]VTZ69985.1 CIR protein [Plasmodium chabaudi chabaudi]|eukprot:XP_016654415.1 CIR protein [Plasmodium chabaudi chabaudi]
MSYHVCEMFNSLYSQLPDDDNEEKRQNGEKLLYESFCPKIGETYQKCSSEFEKISAGFVYLLGQLFGNVNSEGEHEDQKDHYVYYGFLWISYKLQQSNRKSSKPIGLYDFFNNHVVNGDWYEVVEEHVQPKISLLNNNINIDLMSDIYYILKEMCKKFSNKNDNFDYLEDFMNYYDSVKRCGENILKKKSNDGDTDNIDEIYSDLYDMLKNVYNDYRKYYYEKNPQDNAPPELPKIEEIKKNFTPDLGASDLQDSTEGSPEPQDGDGNSEQQQSSSEPTPLETQPLETPPSEAPPSEAPPTEPAPSEPESTGPESPEPESPEPEPPGPEPPGPEPPGPEPHQEPKDEPQEEPQETSQNDSLAEQESIKKFINSMRLIAHYFRPDFPYMYNTLTEFGNDVYKNVLNGLKGSYSMFMNFVNNVKDSIDQLDNEKDTPQPGDNGPKLEDLPSPPSPEQPPKIENSDPQDQKDGDKKEQSGDEQNVDNNQEKGTEDSPPSQEQSIDFTNTEYVQGTNPYISGINRNEIISKSVFSVIVIATPIILAIMYKYLYYGRRKKPKRKKNMKKVINSIGGKRSVKIIINPSTQKKQTKKSKNSVRGEKMSSLNMYELMKADPLPFINLFFLMIFFVYKRTRDSIEL